jgi:hypothetical protein
MMYCIKYSENFRIRLFQLGLIILIFVVLVITPDLGFNYLIKNKSF